MNVAGAAIEDLAVALPRSFLPRAELQGVVPDVPPGWNGSWVAAPDEDPLTLAVAAARRVGGSFASLGLASTSLPYSLRTQAGLVVGALGGSEELFITEHTTSDRAGTEALASHATRAAATDGRALVIATSDGARGPRQIDRSSGAIALTLTKATAAERPVAVIDALGHSVSEHPGLGFVRRGATRRADIGVPDYEAAMVVGLVTRAVERLEDQMAGTGVGGAGTTRLGDGFDRLVVAGMRPRIGRRIARVLGASDVIHPYGSFGDLGAAGALVGLARALEDASDGDRLLVVSLGHGSAVDVVALTAGRPVGGAFSDEPARQMSVGAFLQSREGQ